MFDGINVGLTAHEFHNHGLLSTIVQNLFRSIYVPRLRFMNEQLMELALFAGMTLPTLSPLSLTHQQSSVSHCRGLYMPDVVQRGRY